MNAIYCVASWPGVASVPQCRARDVHLETCASDTCPGCFPRNADRGFLCSAHFDRVEHAYTRWGEFTRLSSHLGQSKAVQRETGGVRTQVLGHVNLTGLFLAVDECQRLQESFDRSLEIWVSTERGASDAIQFAAAAERAYRAHEIQERPHRITRTPCPNCERVLVWSPPAWFEAPVTIQCSGCGEKLEQDDLEEIENPSRFKLGCTGCGWETPGRPTKGDARQDMDGHRCVEEAS